MSFIFFYSYAQKELLKNRYQYANKRLYFEDEESFIMSMAYEGRILGKWKLENNEPINFEKSLLKVGTGYIGNGLGGAIKSVGADNGFNAVQNFIFENGIQSFHNTLQTTIIDTKVD